MQIGEIICEGEKSDILVDPPSLLSRNWRYYLRYGDCTGEGSFIVPVTEIPRWLNSKHQSVKNSISFHVGRKFPNVFAVYFAFGQMWGIDPDDPIYLEVYLSINGFEKVQISNFPLDDVSDTLWVFSRSHLKLQKLLNESNPSDYNHVEVTYEWDDETVHNPPIELRRWGVKVECICCPQESSIPSSMVLTLVDNNSHSDLNLPLKKRKY